MKKPSTRRGFGTAADLARQVGWMGPTDDNAIQLAAEPTPEQTPMPTLSSLPPWVMTAGAFALGGFVVWLMMSTGKGLGDVEDVEEVFDELGFAGMKPTPKKRGRKKHCKTCGG